MSYYWNGPPGIRLSEGAVQSGTASTAVTSATTAQTAVGQALVMVVYANVDQLGAVDTGEGWVQVESQFDATNNIGLAIYFVIARRPGATRVGITLPTAGNWVSATGILTMGLDTARQQAPIQFDLGARCGAGNMWVDLTDVRSMTWDPWKNGWGNGGNGAQGVEIIACGCSNGGTVPTATAPTGYSELLDNGVSAAPSYNVWAGFRNASTSGAAVNYFGQTVTNSTFFSTTGSQTNRCSIRGYIPFCALSHSPGRYLSRRRIMG
jgi:hypothetical protein